MTNKTILFEVNIHLDSIMLISEKWVTHRDNSRTIDEASVIITQQMVANGYWHHTINDYATIIRSFKSV